MRLSFATFIARAFAVSWLMAGAAPLPAAGGAPLGLLEAARMAAAQAPRIAAQDFRRQASQADAVRAGRLPDPVLNFGISSLPVAGREAFSTTADSMTMRELGISQQFPSRAARRADKEAALATAELAGAGVAATRLGVQQQAAMAWVELWAAQEAQRQLLAMAEQSALAIEIGKARLAGGAGSASEALATQVDAETLANRIEASTADIAAANDSLQRWLGPVERPLDDPPDFAMLRTPPAQLAASTDEQGPMLGWSAREAQADAAVRAAHADKRPDWNLSLMYGQRAHYPDMMGVSVGVRLPLFPRNRQNRAIDARNAERRAIAAERADARAAQRESVARTIAQWQGLGRQVSRYRERLLPLAADRSQVALAAYRGGGPVQPWLDARQSELTLRLAYAEALARWGNSWVTLAFLLPEEEVAP